MMLFDAIQKTALMGQREICRATFKFWKTTFATEFIVPTHGSVISYAGEFLPYANT